MIDTMVDGWNQFGYLSKLAVILLIACLAPVLTTILRLTLSWPRATWQYSVRIPVWVVLEVGAFLFAVGIFWVSFLNATDSYEGGRCAGMLADLTKVYRYFLLLLMIPVIIIVVWFTSRRTRGAVIRDA